jgi:Flp pilus assembly pilin Flp
MNNLAAKKSAQSILEYTVLISLVAAALVAMNLYVQRAVKSNLKMIENQILRGS